MWPLPTLWAAVLLLLGGGCGVPEPLYVEHTPPAITFWWPGDVAVHIPSAGAQDFTICARDEAGGPVSYYWTMSGVDRGPGESTPCGADVGMTFSVPGGTVMSGTSVDVAAVARDSRGLSGSRVWVVYSP